MQPSPILVASDLSARNDRAVDRAMALGEAGGRPVILVHACEPSTDEDAARRLERVARDSLPKPDSKVEIVLAAGPAPRTIARLASERDAALIVSGVARFNGIDDYFTGTAVDHVISHGHRPVLVVKARPHRAYDRLLVAVDFSDHSAHALAAAAALFPRAQLHVVHAYHVPFEGFQKAAYVKEEVKSETAGRMEQFLARAELAGTAGRVRSRLAYGSVARSIREAIDAVDPDLFVVGTHGMSGLRRATIGSIASSLLQWVPLDTLVVPPAA